MRLHGSTTSVSFDSAENASVLAVGTLLAVWGLSRRSLGGAVFAVASSALVYRGLMGAWPGTTEGGRHRDDTRAVLADSGGLHVREAVRLERPIAELYAFWRRLENLPAVMQHVVSVTETSPKQSHWIAEGPGGLRVEWDAEIINEIPNQLLAWRSLPDSDVVTAGSVNFDAVRGGRSTQVTVNLQYSPPAGKAGAAIAALFGRAPSQTIREGLRQLKQRMETGEIAQAGPALERQPQ